MLKVIEANLVSGIIYAKDIQCRQDEQLRCHDAVNKYKVHKTKHCSHRCAVSLSIQYYINM